MSTLNNLSSADFYSGIFEYLLEKNSYILFVEDNDILNRCGELILEKLKVPYKLAKDGYEALEHFNNYPITIILLDIGLPGLDGIQVCQRIREKEQKENREPVPIIAITGYPNYIVQDECYRAGFDDIIVKPVCYSRQEMGTKIGDWIYKKLCERDAKQTIINKINK